jgi:peptide/nickel transport system permease protein
LGVVLGGRFTQANILGLGWPLIFVVNVPVAAIGAVATLSFLGFGIAPPATNWGLELSNGIAYIYAGYWWLLYPTGICIVLVVMAFNFVGDALWDALEVRLQRR